jgi:hypothetical protein
MLSRRFLLNRRRRTEKAVADGRVRSEREAAPLRKRGASNEHEKIKKIQIRKEIQKKKKNEKRKWKGVVEKVKKINKKGRTNRSNQRLQCSLFNRDLVQKNSGSKIAPDGVPGLFMA